MSDGTKSKCLIFTSYNNHQFRCLNVTYIYNQQSKCLNFKSIYNHQSKCLNVKSIYNHLSECQFVPSPGRCRETEKRRLWSYSTKIGACTELYGCYGIRDRNVFMTRVGCERSCFVTDSNDPSLSSYLGKCVFIFHNIYS